MNVIMSNGKNSQYAVYFLLIVSILHGCVCSRSSSPSLHGSTFPEFPSRPPQPSATDRIANSYFGGCKTLRDIDNKLLSALSRCGYYRQSYFHVIDGFAMVTQFEQISENGKPNPEETRWVKYSSSNTNSLADYLKNLFFARVGYFRCIVFMITDKPYSFSDQIISNKQPDEWLNGGNNILPSEVGQIAINDSYYCDVLIYEFKQTEAGAKSQLLLPSPVTGREHLDNTHLFDQLK